MPAGKYRDLIVIEHITGSEDEYNQTDLDEDSNWSEFTKRRAHITARGGREFYRGGQIQSEVSHQITIRSDSTTRQITSKMRVIDGTKKLQIVNVREADNKKRELTLDCKES